MVSCNSDALPLYVITLLLSVITIFKNVLPFIIPILVQIKSPNVNKTKHLDHVHHNMTFYSSMCPPIFHMILYHVIVQVRVMREAVTLIIFIATSCCENFLFEIVSFNFIRFKTYF